MMTQVNVWDRPASSSEDGKFGFLEEVTLDMILEAYTRSLIDEYILNIVSEAAYHE